MGDLTEFLTPPLGPFTAGTVIWGSESMDGVHLCMCLSNTNTKQTEMSGPKNESWE